MTKKPLISIVMSAYNVEEYISQAIESILCQTFKDFELIIIDDHSTDNTLGIIKDFVKKDPRIKIVNNRKNLKIAASLNKGIKLSKSEIIARMDPDDIAHPDRLRRQFNFLRNNPNIAVVGSNILVINPEGKLISKREYPTTSKELKKVMFKYSPFAHPVIMFRKKVFDEFGGYDMKTVPCEDIALWFKIGSKYEFASIKKPLLKYRLIKTSGSHSNLKRLELIGLKLKINSVLKYNYRFSVGDIVYNFLEYSSLIFMSDRFRIWFYEQLRRRRII